MAREGVGRQAGDFDLEVEVRCRRCGRTFMAEAMQPRLPNERWGAWLVARIVEWKAHDCDPDRRLEEELVRLRVAKAALAAAGLSPTSPAAVLSMDAPPAAAPVGFDAAVWPFPWREPSGMYDSDGPAKGALLFTLDGAQLRITPTAEEGIDTGRTRYRCECVTCSLELHRATTGPSSRFRQHLEEKHGRPARRHA